MRNKFDQLKLLVKDNIDILIVEEIKIDGTFQMGQFIMDGYMPPFRKDRNQYGGGVLIYIKDNIPAKELTNFKISEGIESIFVELNFRRNKWLLMGTYHPPSQCTIHYYTEVGKALDCYRKLYDNILLIGDFNNIETEINTKNFMESHNLKNLVKEPTCYKNPLNPSCIDLILTNKSNNFKNTTTIDFGLSDCHKLILTTFKFQYKPGTPKIIFYRSYKNFNKQIFENELKTNFHIQGGTDVGPDAGPAPAGVGADAGSISNYEQFENKFLEILNKHAPLKKKTLRANDAAYMTKCLRKAMMKRSELATKYNKSRSLEDYKGFKKHKNYVNKLYKKERNKYFNNLSKNDIQDVKKFWKLWKPLISDNNKIKSAINLINNNQDILSDEKEVASEFRNVFSNAVKNLNMDFEWLPVDTNEMLTDPVDIAIDKFKSHPSILKIREHITVPSKITFSRVSEENVLDLIADFNTRKATTFNNIPGEVLKRYAQTYSEKITELINQSIEHHNFPDKLKLADIFPIYKKGDRNLATNFRPVSVLPYISKLYERILHQQIQSSVDKFLSVNLCGYRKGFSAQHALMSMIEQFRSSLDKKAVAGGILMDLSKAFDCLDHQLLIAKLDAYGFDKSALTAINNYLKNRWQRVKVGNSFSDWFELNSGVPQGSVLGPLLFNIFLNDLLWFTKDCEVCNFADDTTLFACDKNVYTMTDKLEKSSDVAIQWFSMNYFKLNTDKCKLIVCGHKGRPITVRVGDSVLQPDTTVKLLGVTIDKNLNFSEHISKLVSKANSKLFVVRRGLNMLNFSKRRDLLMSFVQSQFSYAPLMWMLCSKTDNKKINKVHFKFLQMLYDDQSSTYVELLNEYGEFTVHQRNTQKLMIEMFKAKNELGPSLLSDIFIKSKYKGPVLRSNKDFYRPNINTHKFGEKSLQNIGNIIWDLLPSQLRELTTLSQFKTQIKKWKADKCPCYLCKNYIDGVGLVELCDCTNCR